MCVSELPGGVSCELVIGAVSVGQDRAAGSGGTAGKASGATLGRCGEAEKMGIDGKGLREICTTTEIHQHHF